MPRYRMVASAALVGTGAVAGLSQPAEAHNTDACAPAIPQSGTCGSVTGIAGGVHNLLILCHDGTAGFGSMNYEVRSGDRFSFGALGGCQQRTTTTANDVVRYQVCDQLGGCTGWKAA
jgi:hypothetical protein